MLPIKSLLQQTQVTVTSVVDIMTDYLAEDPNYEDAAQPLTFNDQGVCTNLPTRKLIESALMSPSCPVAIKNAILQNSTAYPNQFRSLLKGIIEKGYAVHLENTRSDGLDIHKLNFSGGKFIATAAEFNNLNARGANFEGGSVFDVVVYGGDMSNSIFKNMNWGVSTYMNLSSRVNVEGMVTDQESESFILTHQSLSTLTTVVYLAD